MANAEQPRRNPMAERMDRFKTDCAAAGEEFPAAEGVTLSGEPWSIQASRGRVIILETGAFT